MLVTDITSGVARILNVARAQERRIVLISLREVRKKFFAFIFQLPGWFLVAPLRLAGKPGTVQNWLFSC